MYKNVYKLRISCLAKAKEEFTDKIINIKSNYLEFNISNTCER